MSKQNEVLSERRCKVSIASNRNVPLKVSKLFSICGFMLAFGCYSIWNSSSLVAADKHTHGSIEPNGLYLVSTSFCFFFCFVLMLFFFVPFFIYARLFCFCCIDVLVAFLPSSTHSFINFKSTRKNLISLSFSQLRSYWIDELSNEPHPCQQITPSSINTFEINGPDKFPTLNSMWQTV